MSLIRTRVYKKLKKSITSVSDQVVSKLPDYPGYVYTLFYLLATYLVIPVFDVPLLGLSISAPVFFVIAAVVVFKPPDPWFKRNSKWILIAFLIYIGIFLSTALNGILSFGSAFDSSGTALLIQYAYWLLVFVITVAFASQKSVLKKVPTIFAWSILIIAVMRWVEALGFGRIGTRNFPVFLTQNSYGFQFSAFTPFLFVKVFSAKGKDIFGWGLAVFISLAAVIINGSRGSWVAVSLGLILFALLFFISNPKKFSGLVILVIFVALLSVIVLTASPAISNAVKARVDTFSTLEDDKPFLIRQALTQKGMLMFESSPLIGVGAGRFSKNTADLVLPSQISSRENELQRKSSHNSFIQWLAEFGLIGSLPFGFLLVMLVISGFTNARLGIIQSDLIPLGFLISLIQMSAHMWVIAALTGTVAWFMFGLNVASFTQKFPKGKNISNPSKRIIK